MTKPVTPLLAVDAVIEYNGKLVVIDRLNPPLGLAWPGGFVDVGENLHTAVKREAAEEVNLKIDIVDLIGIWDDPDRDPRGHTISVVYLCKAVAGSPVAKDDAKEVRLYTVGEALQLNMIIDHGDMLKQALELASFDRRRL
jgi:ADP-ribose pyrophosphatase YjhB (NUDIX family)